LQVVELREELCERDADGGPRDDELIGDSVSRTIRRGDPGVPANRIEKPDVLDAHFEVIVDAFLHAVDPIFRREDLNANKRSFMHDRIDWIGAAQNRNVGYAVATFSGSDASLWNSDDVPVPAIGVEDRRWHELQHAMGTLSHISLLEFAIDVVAVRLVGRREIFANRDER
jgi:hypothetical protein